MQDRWPIVATKTRIPGRPTLCVDRPRVTALLNENAQRYPVITVVGPPGYGKTTAVVAFAHQRPGRCAWLTLGENDTTAGRLVMYLAAAVAPLDAGLSARVSGFLSDGLPPTDCASLLAEGLPPGSVLVLDDVHAVEIRAPAIRILHRLVDDLAVGSTLVVISRRLIHLDLTKAVIAGRVGRIDERDLALDAAEVAEVLRARGLDADPLAVMAASGGWAAGVVSEAMGTGRYPPDASAEDPFFAYLGSEVLSGIEAPLRDAVVSSAVLDVVTAPGVAAVEGLDARAAQRAFGRIVSHHLPGVREADGFRYHPRFREFLLSLLDGDDPGRAARVRARCARALADDGHVEEAVDQFLAAGHGDEAVPALLRAAPTLMRRGDWDKLLAWLDAVGETRITGASALRGVQIRALMMSRRQQDVPPLVQRMRASGEFDAHLRDDPDVAAWAVWALHGAGGLPELLGIAPDATSSRRCQAVRYILETLAGDSPPRPWPDGAFDRVQPLHVALQSAVYYRGRFAEVEQLAAAAATRGPVTAVLARIYRVAALTFAGDLIEARRELDAATPRIRESRFIEFWQQVSAELAFEEGDRDAGLQLMRDARATSRDHGYRLTDRGAFPTLEGKMLVRMGRSPEASEVLEAARWWCAHHGARCFGEWADTWYAAALLDLGEDAHRAGALLRGAVASMRAADRVLELVPALVLEAEAAWRTGDEDRHDAAMDDAYAASLRLGTLVPMIRTLALVPDTLARRLDAATGDSAARWRAVAQARTGPGEGGSSGTRVLTIRTMGAAVVVAPGGAQLAVPARGVELAAILARAGPEGAERGAVIDALVRSSADGAAYLRQILSRLRRALPAGVDVVSQDGRLAWRPADAVVTDDQTLESLVTGARRKTGAVRREMLEGALAIADGGDYMPGGDAPDTVARRADVVRYVVEARRALGHLQLARGWANDAEHHARLAVAGEPYDEDGWRLLMRATAAARGPSAVPQILRECEGRLAEIGLRPSAETVRLGERLRG